MKRIIEHPNDIVQVKTPLPFPLRWVNSYLIKGSAGYTLIDPGLHNEDTKQHWASVLQDQQISYEDIEQIVLTHHHPDHYGLSGWFQEKTAAPVYLSERSYEQVVNMWGAESVLNEKLVQLFINHGMSQQASERIREHLESFQPLVSPQPQVDFICASSTFRLGDHWYETIEANGHAEGQLCFYEPQLQLLFCGDQVLPRITPNISLHPDGDANPLKSYLSSLLELDRLQVNMTYPGHRDPFELFSARIQEILKHHDERLQTMQEWLHTPRSAYEVCNEIFGTSLSFHQLRFAMAETIAHLQYLAEQQRVEVQEQGSILTYRNTHDVQ